MTSTNLIPRQIHRNLINNNRRSKPEKTESIGMYTRTGTGYSGTCNRNGVCVFMCRCQCFGMADVYLPNGCGGWATRKKLGH